MRSRIRETLGVFFLGAGIAAAEGQLDLKALVAMAEETSPVLEDQVKLTEQFRGRLVSAKPLFPSNPELSYGATTDSAFAREGEGGHSWVLSQEVEVWGQRGLRIRSAQADYDGALRTLESTRLLLVAEVERLALRLLVAGEKVRLYTDLQALTAEVEAASTKKRDAGHISDVAYQLVSFETLAIDAGAQSLRSEHDASLASLRRLVGRPGLDPDDLAGLPDFAALSPDETALVRRAIDSRPDLLALRLQVEAQRTEVTLLKRDRLPRLRLEAGYAVERSAFGAEDIQYVPGVPRTIAGLGDRDRFLSYSATMSIPLYRRNQGELIQKRAETDRTELALQTEENRVATEIGRHMKRMQRQASLVGRMKPALSGVDAALQDVAKAFTLGEYGIDRYLVEKDRLFRVKLAYFDALMGYWDAVLDLELAVGSILWEPQSSSGEPQSPSGGNQ